MFSIPRTAIIKYYKLCALKEKEVISQFWSVAFHNQDVYRAMLPLRTIREDPILPVAVSGAFLNIFIAP